MISEVEAETTEASLTSCMQGNWADRMLLLLLLLGIAASWQWVDHLVSSGPATAYIYHNDVLLAHYPLSQSQPAHINAQGDIGISKIVIDADGARITSSPCNSQYCVLSGNHHRAGDIIACVPNRILLTIRGNNQTDRLDAVSQ